MHALVTRVAAALSARGVDNDLAAGFAVSGSKCTVPLFKANVPCTVCSVLSTIQCTADWAGSSVRTISEVATGAACGEGAGVAAARSRISSGAANSRMPCERTELAPHILLVLSRLKCSPLAAPFAELRSRMRATFAPSR